MSIRFSRYMSVRQFQGELEKLRAFRGESVGDRLLESLESSRLLIPRARVRYPDSVARRFWQERDRNQKYRLTQPVEPDGPRWSAAVDLSNAMYKRQNAWAYGEQPHPLDDIEPRFREFVEDPALTEFHPWDTMRVDVGNDVHPVLYESGNVETFYTAWQVLLTAEVADAGIHFRMNLADKGVIEAADRALRDGKAPGRNYSFHFLPVYAARDFAKHEHALDAVVMFAEESARAFSAVSRPHRGGRFRLTEEQAREYEQAQERAAETSAARYRVSIDDLIAVCRFLGERWSEWDRNGRPLFADAYKSAFAETVRLVQRVGKLSFAQVSDRVGSVGGGLAPILDKVWPDWSKVEQDRVRRSLSGATNGYDGLSPEIIDAFVAFLADNGLEAFFWRLNSFERHTFRGNEFALEGMKSDIQGMAVAVEHVTEALGAKATQLYEKFKQLWQEPAVLNLLKRGDVSQLARAARLSEDWPGLKAKIEELRSEEGGKIAADLVMAHRIRGGVHTILPEDDQFELELLFIALMRAALLTFAEVKRADFGSPTNEGAAVRT